MAIVVNDFEVVAEAPPTQPGAPQHGREDERRSGSQAPEPHDIAPVLLVLRTQALRSWAH